jgi:hypothetical protein
MTDKEKLDFLKQKLNRKSLNLYLSYHMTTNDNGKIEKTLLWYRHPDLYKFAKEAFEKGQDYFCCEPKDPKNPYGHLHLVDTIRYNYNLTINQEEYDIIFGEDNND